MPDEPVTLYESQAKALDEVLAWWKAKGRRLAPKPSPPTPLEPPVPFEIARPRKAISSTVSASTHTFTLYPSTATIPLQRFVEKKVAEKDGYGKRPYPGAGSKPWNPVIGSMNNNAEDGLHPDTGSTIQARELAHGGASVFDRFLVFRHHQGGKQYALPIRAPLSIVGGELHTMGATKSDFLAWGAQQFKNKNIFGSTYPGSTGEWDAKGLGAEISLVTEATTYILGHSTGAGEFTFGGAWSLVQDVWFRNFAFLSSTGLAANTSYRIFIYDSPTTWSTAGSTNWETVPGWATQGWVSRFKLQAVPASGAGSSDKTLDLTRGAPVMKSDPRKRYIGAVTTTTDGKFENSKRKRYVLNHYNPRCKEVEADVTPGPLSGSSVLASTDARTSGRIWYTVDGAKSYALHLHYHALIKCPASTPGSTIGTTGRQLHVQGVFTKGYGTAMASSHEYQYPLELSDSYVTVGNLGAGSAYFYIDGSYAGQELIAGKVRGVIEC
jgi:hypothetical protein